MPLAKTTSRHWIVLLFACLLMFGNYYAYDIPGAINTQLKEWLGSSENLFPWQLNFLYSVYSLPNVFLPLIGGILVDKLGPARMMVIFSSLICIGQVVFALGLSSKLFYLMAWGRILFGLGGESLEVAQASITTDWFQGRGLALALGLNISFARIAAALNDNLSPVVAEKISVPATGWIGVGACLLSSMSSVVLIFLDNAESRKASGVEYGLDDDVKDAAGAQDEALEDALLIPESIPEPPALITVPSIQIQTPDEEDSFKDAVAFQDDTGYDSEEYEEEDETVHFSQALGFSLPFWLLFLNTIVLYGSVQPFFHVCTDYFQQRWYHNDPRKAGFAMSVPDIISAVGTPFAGLLIDRYGKRTLLISLSGAFIFTSLALMTFTMVSPVISMSLLGLSYSVFTSALWPCVPFLVGRHQMATAYGLLSVALNITLSVVPLIVAQLRGAYPDHWEYTLGFFLTLSALSIVLSSVLHQIDRGNGGVLGKGSTRKAATPRGDDTEPLLGASQSDNEEEEPLMAKVITEGIVVPVPHTIIHHHHHIRHSDPNHVHTTHCRCYESAQNHQSSLHQTPRRGKSPHRKSSPVRRVHLQVPGQSPTTPTLSIPASI